MLNLKHGGEIVPVDGKDDKATKDAKLLAKKLDGIFLVTSLLPGKPAKPELPEKTFPFAYMFQGLKDDPNAHLPGTPQAPQVTDALDALGNAMTDQSTLLENNSDIPAVYIYWGQFIDHDMTANTGGEPGTFDITKVKETGPVPPAEVVAKLRNLRRATLDLDSVYGDGPAFLNKPRNDDAFYDGPRFRLGKNTVDGITDPRQEKIPPVGDLTRDLPRIGPLLDAKVISDADLPESLQNDPNKRTRPLIGDLRNDENLIVAQFHVAFLRFHNKVVDRLSGATGQGLLDDLLGGVLGGLLGGTLGQILGGNAKAKQFEVARRLTRWHYQWLVVNDFLKTMTLPGTVDKVLYGGNKLYKKPFPNGVANGELYMPLEYSVAAYRFGHSMIRSGYDHNRNFGNPLHPAPPPAPTPQNPGRASFEQLFEFTGNGFTLKAGPDRSLSQGHPLGGFPTLPHHWIIEWDRFTRKDDFFAAHFGKKIDTQLSAFGPADPFANPPSLVLLAMLNMVNEGTNKDIQDDPNKPIRELLRHLAKRNLRRGYLLSLPTGQAVAAAMGIAPLTEAELKQGSSQAVIDALTNGGFLQKTPLWFYILKESEVRANGNFLGEVGSRIVVETIIGILRNDPNSYLNAPGGWNPSKGVKLANGDPIVTIRDFLNFSGVPA